jgi:hypothetical protein
MQGTGEKEGFYITDCPKTNFAMAAVLVQSTLNKNYICRNF